MAKFLNKKEDVFDIKLTSYGKHLLGLGKFKPVYYAFYDDNIIYDKNWASGSEVQNDTHKRIKEETQYIEGYTLFQELEKNINRDGIEEVNFFSIDITPSEETPRKDMFKFDQALGDAYLQGSKQVTPAWKLVSLENSILSSSYNDYRNNSQVPQIHLTASYELKITDEQRYYENNFNSTDPRKFELVTERFVDNKIVYLESHNPLVYLEELNTELLTKNFDIEVFEMIKSRDGEEFENLNRKYFTREEEQIKNGIMMYAQNNDDMLDFENSSLTNQENLTYQSVNYFFDLIFDKMINEDLACKGSDEFNKQSYFIDIDFECDKQNNIDDVVYDIYGSAVEAEICLD
jgi:hypothetical protein